MYLLHLRGARGHVARYVTAFGLSGAMQVGWLVDSTQEWGKNGSYHVATMVSVIFFLDGHGRPAATCPCVLHTRVTGDNHSQRPNCIRENTERKLLARLFSF